MHTWYTFFVAFSFGGSQQLGEEGIFLKSRDNIEALPALKGGVLPCGSASRPGEEERLFV
jgi:hypothetical protein